MANDDRGGKRSSRLADVTTRSPRRKAGSVTQQSEAKPADEADEATTGATRAREGTAHPARVWPD